MVPSPFAEMLAGQRIPEAYRGSMSGQMGAHSLSISSLQKGSGHLMFDQLSLAINPVPRQARASGPALTCLRNIPLLLPRGSVGNVGR